MAEATDKKGILLQNLQDAGCDESMIHKCINYAEQGKTQEILFLLQKYKPILLEKIHSSQDELDCLDFLIYQLKKSEKKRIMMEFNFNNPTNLIFGAGKSYR